MQSAVVDLAEKAPGHEDVSDYVSKFLPRPNRLPRLVFAFQGLVMLVTGPGGSGSDSEFSLLK